MINVLEPQKSIDKMLGVLQQQRHPTSLVQHATFGSNINEKLYDFKVIWLQRDFVDAVYSRFSDWKNDGTIEHHAIMMGAYELYIATEVQQMENGKLGKCVKVQNEGLDNSTRQREFIWKISSMIGVKKCSKCFK